MKFAFLLICMIHCLACGGAQPPADSLMHWIEIEAQQEWLDGVAAWQAAPDSPRPDLPLTLKAPLMPFETRPAWAQVSDSALWSLYQQSKPTLTQDYNHAPQSLNVPLDASQTRALMTASERQLWQFLFGFAVLMWILLAGGYAWLKRQNHRQVLPQWQGLQQAIRTGDWTNSAREAWRAFKARQEDDSEVVDVKIWHTLTKSEQELARHLAQHLPVNTIAQHMSCTPSYLYNLRSSIRRKMQLTSEEDLNFEIQKLLGKL